MLGEILRELRKDRGMTQPLPYDRRHNTITCPADFTDEEIESVRRYVAFLQYSREGKQKM